jgi:hypothetical protein
VLFKINVIISKVRTVRDVCAKVRLPIVDVTNVMEGVEFNSINARIAEFNVVDQ